MKILVCDEVNSAGLEKLRAIPKATVDIKTGLSEEGLIKEVPSYEALLVRSGVKITRPVIEAAKELRVIVRAGMGHDNIDLHAATEKGVAVMNTPGSNAVTTAEHTIAMILALARNIPQAAATLREGKWDRKSFVGTELSGKCLGIVGLGNVGRLVASRARGLKMDVIGYDPFIQEKLAHEAGATVVKLDELFSRADFITIHAVLSDETKHLLSTAAFKKMKKGVRIINCARGEIVEEQALVEALKTGQVAGAALDVFEKEPPPKDHPLLLHPKVIATPHLGASTTEAQEQVVTAAVEQLRLFVVDDIIINGVNVPSVSRDVLAALGRYLHLAGRLGSFVGQLGLSPVEEIQIECSGEITKYNTAPITVAAISGLLETTSSTAVNFVNAPVIAKERGIKVVESRAAEAGDYLSLISVTVRSGREKHRVDGSVFGREQERLIRFDNFFLEVIPEGNIVLIQNEDKPGVVGAWGTLLGKNKINISQMQVALDKEKKEALSIVNVDSSVPQKVIEELKKVVNIRDVRQIRL